MAMNNDMKKQMFTVVFHSWEEMVGCNKKSENINNLRLSPILEL
jgi:hypothetical protein